VNGITKIKKQPTTAVWRNWGFRQTLKLVLYLQVRSLIYTFGLSNPQLTPSHETLAVSFRENFQPNLRKKRNDFEGKKNENHAT
jgi:hypothetical protein